MANSEPEPELLLHELPELPEAIIERILSFLETEKDGIRASSLSKAWQNAWQTRPVLHFNEELYYKQTLGLSSNEECAKLPSRVRFLIHVNRSLQRYRKEKIGIKNLKLDLVTSLVNEWIKVAVENGVENLELGVCPYSTLPPAIFEATSLLELSIQGFFSRLKLPHSIKCHSLKSLHLRSLRLDKSTLQSIISSCQKIEDLKLWYCHGIDNLKVTNVPKLKQFWYSPAISGSDHSVEVEAPNLEFFICNQRWCCPSLISTSHYLKRLVLLEVGINDEFFFDFKHKFPHLEDLRVHHCLNLERIRLSSASLRKMELNVFHREVLGELHIDAPSMIHFQYSGMMPEVSSARVSSHCRSDIHTWSFKEDAGAARTQWFLNLNEFLKSFTPSKIFLCLYIWITKKEKMAAPLLFDGPQVHELSLEIVSDFSTIWEEVLDGVFCACRPKTLRLFINDKLDSEEMIELISKKLMITRNEDYYRSQHNIKFWEGSLKKVTVLKLKKKREPEFEWERGSEESVFELEWETSCHIPLGHLLFS